jgi:hypothetical protein
MQCEHESHTEEYGHPATATNKTYQTVHEDPSAESEIDMIPAPTIGRAETKREMEVEGWTSQ